jgi:hypothetical protein
MLCFNLANINISDDYFWIKVVNEVKYHLDTQAALENKVLVIKLQDVVHEDSQAIPKLEFKN